MNNVFLLIKNYINSFFGSIAKNKRVGKYLNAVLFVGIVSFLMLTFFVYSSYVLTKEFIMLDNVNYSYAGFAIFSTCSNLVLMSFLMIVLKSTAPTKSTDGDLLLSMPIKKWQIIVAKSIASYFFDFIALLGFIFPSFVIYVILVKTASLWIMIRGLAVIIIMPLLLNGLSTIIGNIINKLTKKMKLVSLVQMILLIGLIICFFAFNFMINDILTKNEGISLTDSLDKIWLIKIFYDYIINNKVAYFLIILFVAILCYGLGTILRTSEIGREKVYTQNNQHKLKYGKKSAFANIYTKEANRYFTSPIYIMNTSMGVILVIVAAAYVMMNGREIVDTIVMQVLKLDQSHSPFVVLLIAAAFLATICTTYCSISLEGKSFWILKSLPINEKTIFYGKIMFNVTISSVAGIISTILICMVFGFKYLFVYLSFIILLSFLISSLGLYFNLLYPKMQWDSEVVPIKQSMSVLVIMAIGFIIPIIFLTIYLLINMFINKYIIIFIFDLLLIIVNLVVYQLINKKGAKLFRSIS